MQRRKIIHNLFSIIWWNFHPKPSKLFWMLFAILFYGAESKLLVLIRVSWSEKRFVCNFEFFLQFWTSITPFVLLSWNIHFAGLDWSLNWPIWAFVDILSDDIVNPWLRLVEHGLFLGQFVNEYDNSSRHLRIFLLSRVWRTTNQYWNNSHLHM